jgi:hypothetical protein
MDAARDAGLPMIAGLSEGGQLGNLGQGDKLRDEVDNHRHGEVFDRVGVGLRVLGQEVADERREVLVELTLGLVANVSNTIDDFPEPDTPVKIVSLRLGIWSVTSLRLFSRAPRTSMLPNGEPMRASSPRFTTFELPEVTSWANSTLAIYSTGHMLIGAYTASAVSPTS